MYTERFILKTDQNGHLQNWPKLPENKQFEVIFLMLENVSKREKRTPHPDIAGKVKITGNIFDSIPSSDWNLSL